jgi:hypothetical protein
MTSSRLRLEAPDLNSRRARFADWIELQALTSARQSASIALIRSLVRRQADDRARARDVDADADDTGEAEITDRLPEDLEERLAAELAFRIQTIGKAYPFELDTTQGGRSQLLRLRNSWSNAQSGELVYVFCLLDSGIRDGLISYPPSANPLVNAIGNVFQICSCVAVGGYTNAEVVSFGFPRATGTSFLPALQQAWNRYGSYSIRTQIPHGFDDKLKDGGVDIIAWRHFADRFAATLIMFVQVASGLNWKDKDVSGDVLTLKKWFSGPTIEHFLPAICIPFPLWFDLDEPAVNEDGNRTDFSDGVRTSFMYREGKFGVIFDRGRIAHFWAQALEAQAERRLPYPVDGIDRVCEVEDWVNKVMSNLAEVRSKS